MSQKTVLTQLHHSILKITLNRPESFNALSMSLIEELHSALLQAEQDSAVRTILLTGAGKAFCSGGDVKFFSTALSEKKGSDVFHKMPTELHDLVLTLKNLKVPVIGAINGPAVGAGFSLAVACDLLVASENAYFSLGYLNVGLSPDGGSTFFLPRMLGAQKTFELLALGEKLTAEQAKELGFVAKVFLPENFISEAEALATTLAELPTQAVGVAKQLIFGSLSRTIESQLKMETEGVKRISATDDFAEGVAAFVEKRSPRFLGK